MSLKFSNWTRNFVQRAQKPYKDDDEESEPLDSKSSDAEFSPVYRSEKRHWIAFHRLSLYVLVAANMFMFILSTGMLYSGAMMKPKKCSEKEASSYCKLFSLRKRYPKERQFIFLSLVELLLKLCAICNLRPNSSNF
jgi:hypothetical protein